MDGRRRRRLRPDRLAPAEAPRARDRDLPDRGPAAGAYLGRSQFVDDVVNERVAMVSAERNALLAHGAFEGVAHSARRTAA